MTVRPPRRRSPLGWVAREGWLIWALAILIGGVLPIAAIFDLPESDAWSLSASLVHLAEFAVFTMLVAVAWRRRVPSSTGLIPAAVLGLLYGLAIEIIQGPIPWRDFSWSDFGFDALGIALGALLLTLVRGARGSRPWARG
jgi:VanZ family protein